VSKPLANAFQVKEARVSSFELFLVYFWICLVFVWTVCCCEHVGCLVWWFGYENV